MGGKGNMIIVNGPQVSSVIERVNGCKDVIAKHPDVKLLSSDQDAKGSRDGGLAVMQSLLTRYHDGRWGVRDQRPDGDWRGVGGQADATDQLPDHRGRWRAGRRDRAEGPEPKQFVATASQDPFLMARLAVQEGVGLLNGTKPAKDPLLMDSKLVTRDNVGDYKGWTSAR